VAFETVTTEAGYHITADEATKLDMTGNKVIFNGHVMMTSPQFKLSADQLIVHLGSDKKTFKFIEANQSVKVELVGVPEEKRYRGQSQKAIYEPSKDSIVMTGWPKIQGQGQELIAAEEKTKITMFSKTGKMFTEGRAQTRVSKQLMAEESAKPVGSRQ
jgi:lipopolysaccharide transport protein LptA